MENRSTRGKIKTARVPTRDGKKCSAIFRAVGKRRYYEERYGKDHTGARVVEG